MFKSWNCRKVCRFVATVTILPVWGPIDCPQKVRRAGFTLADMVIVVLIIGIMAAVAAPQFAESVATAHVEAAVQRIEQDLEFARKSANTRSENQPIVFDPEADTYTLPGVADLDRRSQDYVVRLGDAPYQVDLVSAEFGEAPSVTSTLTFNMFGYPDQAGSIVVQFGNKVKTVSVELYVLDCPVDET
jgi:type II secretory pathway pseudopilin PulG